MKIRRAMLLGVLTIGLAAGPHAMAFETMALPLPAGNFSLAAQGSEASCTGGACVTLGIIEAGSEIRDSMGNACGTHAAVVNTIPPGASAPTIAPTITAVLKVTYYDPRTGVGDETLTEYVGGSCNGAAFQSAGATQVISGALHFVVSLNGSRIDSVVTALQSPGLGGFSLSFTELRQQGPENSPFH